MQKYSRHSDHLKHRDSVFRSILAHCDADREGGDHFIGLASSVSAACANVLPVKHNIVETCLNRFIPILFTVRKSLTEFICSRARGRILDILTAPFVQPRSHVVVTGLFFVQQPALPSPIQSLPCRQALIAIAHRRSHRPIGHR